MNVAPIQEYLEKGINPETLRGLGVPEADIQLALDANEKKAGIPEVSVPPPADATAEPAVDKEVQWETPSHREVDPFDADYEDVMRQMAANDAANAQPPPNQMLFTTGGACAAPALDPETLKLNPTDTLGYLRLLFEPKDYIDIKLIHETRKWIDKKGEHHAETKDFFQTLEQALQPSTLGLLTQLQNDGWHIYTTMNAYVHGVGRRLKKNVTEIRTAYVEFDDNGDAGLTKIAEDVKAGLMPAPHFILQSSPGKYYVVWRVTNFTVRTQEALNRALVQRYGSDPQSVDASRVLRLPGTRNLKAKYNPTPVVQIIQENVTRRYTPEEFKVERVVPPEVNREAAPEKVQMRMAFYEEACEDAGVEAGTLTAKGDGSYYYTVSCPNHEEHEGGGGEFDCSVWISPSGAISFRCFHSHCADKDWKTFYRPWMEEQAEENGFKGFLKFGEASEVEKEVFIGETTAKPEVKPAGDAGDAQVVIVDDPSDHDPRFEMHGEMFDTKVYEDVARHSTIYPEPGDDLISVLAKTLVQGTPISVSYVREPLKAIVLHAIDGQVIHPAHQTLTLRGNHFNLGESESGKTTGLEYALQAAAQIFNLSQIHLESLFRYKSEQTFLRSFTPEGTIKRDPQGKIKSGDPGHSSQFLHIKEGNLVASSSDYFGAVFSQITNLYDQTEAGTESMTNGVFNAKTIKVSTVMCFTPTDFVSTFGGKGCIGGGGLNRWTVTNPPEDHSYDDKDWKLVSGAEIQAAVGPLASRVFELREHGPVVLKEEEGAAKIRLETKAMLRKIGKAGKRLMEYFMREQVAQAATAADGRFLMTTQQAEYAKRWVEAQLDCRLNSWPSDANNQIEGMEHAIRKTVNHHYVSEIDLKDACNYYREGSGGWFAFSTAMKNMIASGAIKHTGQTRKGARTYCPGFCAVHPVIVEEEKPKKKA